MIEENNGQLGPNQKKKLLVINPNSTTRMSDSLRDANGTRSATVEYHYFTAPSGPRSINNEDDAADSLTDCSPALSDGGYLEDYDAFLVACYSRHPLVPWLRKQPQIQKSSTSGEPKPVMGILEASIEKSLKSTGADQTFGIISTGKIWETLLTEAVRLYFEEEEVPVESRDKFAGVQTTGLNATELHDAPAQEVRKRMKDATKRLVASSPIGAICLGCAGMAGMDQMIGEAIEEQFGKQRRAEVTIVDGVTAGIALLDNALQRQN